MVGVLSGVGLLAAAGGQTPNKKPSDLTTAVERGWAGGWWESREECFLTYIFLVMAGEGGGSSQGGGGGSFQLGGAHVTRYHFGRRHQLRFEINWWL